ncbi:MAG: DNA mismatch repair protein MutL, partial [bacterium]|nr:DNA mismatch repair protein MutL [bacterium]
NPSQPPLTSRGGEGVPPLDIRGGQGELANACVDHPGHSSTQFSFSQSPYGSLRVLGQVHKTYLVCESENALVLIDQHAAHERIGFEKLKKQFQEGKIQSQRLLIPINVDLTPSETALLKEYTVELLTLGLEVDFFGGNTFVIRSVPDLLFKADYQELIRDLVAEISSFDKLTPLREKIYEVLERMACHRQVRAGDRLSEPEINALLQELEVVPFSSNCPHGRPVCIELSWNDLEKGFKRKL